MKTRLTVSILIGVTLITLSFIIIPRVIVNNYLKKADEFIKVERFQTAQGFALKAKKVAKQWHLQPAYVRSLLYEVKCRFKLNNNLEEITKILKTEKDINPSPSKEIIASLYLEKLWDFYYRHRRRWYRDWDDNTEKTYLDNGDDIASWSDKRLLLEIVTNINTLQNAHYLKSYSFSGYQKQICSNSEYQIQFKTVYEFTTWHSIELLNWSYRFFHEDYVIRNRPEEYFIPLKEFLQLHIAPTDTFDLNTKSMVLYQDLLKFEKDNFNHRLVYEIDIQRLNSLKAQDQSENSEQKFLTILETYRKEAKQKDIQLLLDFALFNEYRSERKTNEYKKKCLEIIRNYPEYRPEVVECKRLMAELSEKHISFSASNIYTYGKSAEVEVTAQNTDTVYTNLFKLSDAYCSKYDFEIKTDSAYHAIPKNCIEDKCLVFKNEFSQNENKHLNFCNLKNGVYLFAIGYKKDLSKFSNISEWQIFRVSSLGSFYCDNSGKLDIYALNRNNGAPIKDAAIIPFANKKHLYKTDESGKISISDTLLFYNFNIGYKGDTLAFGSRSIDNYNDRDNDEVFNLKLFTDRKVYRPSQTVYFKGILDQKDLKAKKYLAVANKKVHLTFKNYDFSYGAMDVVTNEFGSFSGSFKIPARVSLGEMQISTDYGDQDIQIEEYKATKLRLSVLPNLQPVIIGDSLIVTGYAKYLNGLAARNLPITYTIQRTVSSQYHYYGQTVVSSGTVTSDQLGQFKIKIKTNRSKSDTKGTLSYEYSFMMSCKDEFGEMQFSNCNVPVGNSSCIAKIEIGDHLIKRPVIKIPVSFSYNDNPVSSQKCRLTIYKLIDKPVKNRKPNDDSYQNLSRINFDSLSRGKMVFDKTLENLTNYEFNASNLNDQEPGFYVAEVNALVDNKINANSTAYFTLFENKPATLGLNVEHFLISSTEEAQPGQTIKIIAGSSLPDVYGLLVISKNHETLSRKWIHLSKSQQTIDIPVKETHRGGFHISFLTLVNGAFHDESILIKVPFDNKQLHIAFKSFRNNLYPGQQETWNLQVKDNNGKPARAEMVATLYDKALDEIRPNYYSYFPYATFTEDKYEYGSWDLLNCALINGTGSQSGQNDIELPPPPPPHFDGYLGTITNFPVINWDLNKKCQGRSTIFYNRRSESQYNKTKFEADRVSYSSLANITPPPPRATVKFTPPEVTEDELNNDNVSKSHISPIKGSPTKLRKDFRETAVFVPQLRTDAKGMVTMSFTMPDALTKWKMLGFAHTTDMKTGSITNELVTQKDFMVVPNWPRFFRSGDTVSFNVRIENNTGKNIQGNIHLEIEDASNRKSVGEKVIAAGSNQKFSIKGKDNSFTQWKLIIPQNTGTLLFRVTAQSGTSADGEEMILPVLPNEVLITESMPFFIPDNEPRTFHFESFKKQDFKDLRNYQYSFEIAPNPKWNVITALGYLTDYPYECAEQTCNKYFGYCLAEYISKNNSSINQFFNKKGKTTSEGLLSSLDANPDLKSCLLEESPWLFEAKTMTEKALKLSEHFNKQTIDDKKSELSDKLLTFQNTDGGIAWFKGMESSTFISYYLLEALGKMNKLGILNSLNADQSDFITNLIKYCDENLSKWYQDNIKSKTNCFFLNHYLMTSYAYGRSYFLKDYPIQKSKQEAYNYLIKQLGTDWQKTPKSQRSVIAMVLFRNGNTAVANQIIESLKEFAILDPQKGMSWDFDNDYYFNRIENQASILELFIETKQNQKDIDNIKNWLYLNKKNNYWYSTISTAKACYSLLLNEPKWFTPSSFKVEVGAYSFTTGNTITSSNPAGGYRKSWTSPQISKNMGDIKIDRVSNEKTPAWGSAYWQYFKKMDKLTETSSGIWIKKLYFVKRNKEYKQFSIHDKLKVGDEVIVRLEFGTDKPISYVHVKDLRPTCLEPMDNLSGYHYGNDLGYFESIRDVSQNFFIENMPKGKYVIEYHTRVTHRGYFQTGNASIQCMYAPEYVGNSKSNEIRVN